MLLPPGTVLVPPAVAALLAPRLVRAARADRVTDGAPWPAQLLQLVDDLERASATYRTSVLSLSGNAGTPGQHTADRMPLSQAAALAGVSRRALQARVQRGTLPATRSPRGWLVDPLDLVVNDGTNSAGRMAQGTARR